MERNIPASVANGDPYLERVEDHVCKLELIRDSAMKNNDDKTAIAASREVRGGYEILGKATHKFQPMFGPAEQGPLFVLPSTAELRFTINQERDTEINRQREIRNVTPSALPEGESGGSSED
jgi:hypothetical protein